MPFSTAGEGRTPLSARKNRHFGCGLASLLLHAATIGALLMVVTPPLPSPPPDATPIDLVFEQPAPVAATPPEPPQPAAEAPPEPAPPPPPPPEQPPPQPVPPPSVVTPPAPEPPPPEPVRPPPEPRPQPKRPAVRELPPRPRERAPAAAPPRAEPATRPPAAAPVAPVMNGNWFASVSAWLASHKTYPELARQRGEVGNVLVRFTVDRAGRVTEAAVVKTSGSTLLDEAALRLLQRAVFPAFPADMVQAQITMTITVGYSLQ